MNQALVIFQALSEPTRLRILRLLREMELSVGELAQVLGQSQPRVSRHVRILAEAGLVARRKEGSWVFLTLGPQEDLGLVFRALDRWDRPYEGQTDAQRLQTVRNVRAGEAENWFEEHAVEWDAIRSLHVDEKDVEAVMASLLGSGSLGRLVDIGTGTGRMLELFAGQAVSAVGFDRSPAMLRLARAKLAHVMTATGGAVDLRQGDFYALPIEEGCVDVALMHQVLHYAQHPAAVITEAARLLASGGRFLVVDFAPHDREDLRMRDAHACLGLADADMAAWFQMAGLDLAETQALKGALTVKLWLAQKP